MAETGENADQNLKENLQQFPTKEAKKWGIPPIDRSKFPQS